MIPFDFITEWRQFAPWVDDTQVEQDLIVANLSGKLSDPRFLNDIAPLLAPGCPWDIDDAARYARDELLVRLPGDPWKGWDRGVKA